MMLLVRHSCGTLSTYTVRLQDLIIHEAEKEDMEHCRRQFFALE